MKKDKESNKNMPRKKAIHFIVLLGLVSLFADITYEGARSIIGPYLSLLGASGAAVGIIVGVGEFAGYGLRVLFGFLSDKTQRYWAFTLIGYFINLFAIPLLAFAGSWQMAAFLIIMERFGKAIRVPARDTILSFATKETGRGWGFGIHEALDQVGALIGPLAISLSLWKQESYSASFALLFIPALIAMGILLKTQKQYPLPQEMEKRSFIETKGFPKPFWIYIFASGLVAAGFSHFALISYHFQKSNTVPGALVPLLYALAMGVDGIFALIMGRLYDKKGISILALATAVSALFAPLVFLAGFYGALAGMILWGIGMGSQETLLRALVPELVSTKKRASAYGILNLGIGLFWFLGSSLMGILYDYSLLGMVLFSLAAQCAAIPLFFLLKKRL